MFGQSLILKTMSSHDSIEHHRVQYETYLGATSLPERGVALDIGAGTGVFAIPFAKAFPNWAVWCFEPDPEKFELLEENTTAHKISNIHPCCAAIGGQNTDNLKKLSTLLGEGDLEKALSLCPEVPLPGVASMSDNGADSPEETGKSDLAMVPQIPVEALIALKPTLLKLRAPNAEELILEGLKEAELDHIMGTLDAPVPSRLIFGDDIKGKRHANLPLTTEGGLALRRAQDLNELRPGLDVVVAMYNARDYILECVNGIISNTSSDIHAVVVDDGSTDGGGDLVEETYRNNPRVRVLRKPNGGCASARNYGRMHSNTSHIAFVDADDVIDAEMFPQLMELARYTGAETVQAAFDLLHMDADGSLHTEESYEQSPEFTNQFKRNPFGQSEFCVIPSTSLMVGQPTIWRRVYRRDFLNSRDIWFPEHIRAFDDQIFQMLSLFYAATVPAIDNVRYHYRQHPGQDIKQGDERFFYSLEMFRIMVKRGIREGWNNFSALLTSYVNTVNWIHGELRQDLKPTFLKSAALLWVLMQKTLGSKEFESLPETSFAARDFPFHAETYRNALNHAEELYSFIYLDSWDMHVPILKMPRPTRDIASKPETDITASHVETMLQALGGQLISGNSTLNRLPFEKLGSLITLSPETDGPKRFLDGVVAGASLGLVESAEIPFTGTQWVLQLQLNGLWLLVNQRDLKHCLAIRDGQLCLREHIPGLHGLPTYWRIVRQERGFVFVSAENYLLTHSDGAPSVAKMPKKPKARFVSENCLWEIKLHPEHLSRA